MSARCVLSWGQTIRTTYRTETSSAAARSNSGASLRMGRDFALSHEETHRQAAEVLASKLGWNAVMFGGWFGNSMYWVQKPDTAT